MQQSLTFYEVVLAHDHPVLVGLFRLALCNTKNQTDKLIARLYVVTLTFLLFNLFTGMFSLNVRVPHNGEWKTHLEPDGSVPPKNWFGIVIAMVVVAGAVCAFFVRSEFFICFLSNLLVAAAFFAATPFSKHQLIVFIF